MRGLTEFWLLAFAFSHECRYDFKYIRLILKVLKVMNNLALSASIPVCWTIMNVKRHALGVQAVNSTVELI